MAASFAAPRIAVVGLGPFGTRHARILAGLDDVNLVALAHPYPAHLHQIADELGVAHRYGGAAELLADTRNPVDAVVVATPGRRHAEHVRAVLAGGCHCLVEKPLALTHIDAAGLAAAADNEGVVLQVGHVLRFSPAYHEIKAVGPPPERNQLIRAYRFFRTPARTGLHLAFEAMIHDIDLALWFSSADVINVRATGLPAGSTRPSYLSAQLRLSNGGLAALEAGWLPPRTITADTVDAVDTAAIRAGLEISTADERAAVRWPGDSDAELEKALRNQAIHFTDRVRDPLIPTDCSLDQAVAGIEIAQRIAALSSQ